MADHGYEGGRLNLPFVGLCSFGKYPYQPDWTAIDADFAVLGRRSISARNSGRGQDLARAGSAKRQRSFPLGMPEPMIMRMI